MNIFVIDPNPVAAANLPDKLVVKMVLETAQLLSTALRLNGADDELLYRATHENHPCSIWTRATRGNFLWLCHHGLALCDQYTARYGKIHKSRAIIERCEELLLLIPDGKLQPFALAMPEEFKGENTYSSYRTYLTHKSYFQDGWKKSVQMPNYKEWSQINDE